MGNRKYAFTSKEIDERFCYDGKDLGVRCTEEGTVFRVWSPLAERVELRLYLDDVPEACQKREMLPEDKGVWKQEFSESLHGMYYDYLVRVNGLDTRTADPYAVGKDFSYDPDSGVPEELRGKYKAFTVPGKGGKSPACMEYLKKLGITHVHLLPFFDFGSVDEAGDGSQFNWGYDPVNYNVPEGS